MFHVKHRLQGVSFLCDLEFLFLLYFIRLARIFHELLSPDHETGNPLARLSGAQRARIRWASTWQPQGVGFRT